MDKNKLRVVFMGTPLIAKIVLEGLVNDGYNVVLAITNIDKITGRKKVLTPSEVKEYALSKNIEVFQPKSIKQDYQRVLDVKGDILITCAYGQIIPKVILDSFKYGCLNVHGSLLPHLRGASPIQSALFEGLKETGVTIMEMIEKMDAGRMFHKEYVKIEENDNYTSLYNKLALAGKDGLLKMLPNYLNNENKGEIQDEEKVTFCKKIKPEDEYLSLDLNIYEFINRVKGLSYTPGGYVYYKDKKLKILMCSFYSNEVIKEVGSLIKKDKNTLLLQLKDGLIKIDEVQKEGKNRMPSKIFMNGENNLETFKVS